MGGFQNTMTFHLAGLDIDQKAETLKRGFLDNVGGEKAFDKLDIQLFKTQNNNPTSNEEAFSHMRISVVDQDPQKAGKFFTSKLIELALCTVPGWCMSQPPGPAKPRIVHFPALIDKKYLKQIINVNGEVVESDEILFGRQAPVMQKSPPEYNYIFKDEQTEEIHLGKLYATRSGDKGGNANLGVWAKTPKAYAFLKEFLTVEKLKALLPDTATFEIIRYDFPNLLGMNFYLIGFLQDGVAASTKMDSQAKTLGEYLRVKKIDVPVSLIRSTGNDH